MRKLILVIIAFSLLVPADGQNALPFSVLLNPSPAPVAITPICSAGDQTIRTIGFTITDDFADGIPTNWSWSIVAVDIDDENVVLPLLDTDVLGGELAGSIPDGEAVSDQLFINGFGATGGDYLLVLSVQSPGLNNEKLYEYPILVGKPTFDIVASALNGAGEAVICSGQGEDRTPVVLSVDLQRRAEFEPYTFLWSSPGFNSTEETIAVDRPIAHSLRITNGCGAVTTKNIAVTNGNYPVNPAYVYPLPDNRFFNACPAESGGMIYLEATGENATGFQWQVRPPGEEREFIDLEAGPENPVIIPVDALNHRDGAAYRVKVDNDGCARIPEGDSIVLTVMQTPEFTDPQLSGGTVDVEGSITFNQVVSNIYQDNTSLIWELADPAGAWSPVSLRKADGSDITAADAVPLGSAPNAVEGSVLIPTTGLEVSWSVTVTAITVNVITSQLVLTNNDGGTGDAVFQTRLRVINRDDNNIDTTGIDRMDCNQALTEAAGLTFLPVELLYFIATEEETGILLQWATASESNNDFFTIERSVDGKAFVPVEEIPGAGTFYRKLDYSFLDENLPPVRQLYYRLKQTDFDGRFAYSDIVSVQRKLQSSPFDLLRVFRQESTLRFSYSLERDGAVSAALFDVNGRLLHRAVLSGTKGLNEGQMLPGDLPKGLFLLRLQKEGQTNARRFLW